jgi:hypothetical protein
MFPDVITGWRFVGYHDEWTGPRRWSSTIGPCYNYQLDPSVMRNSAEVVEPNSSISVSSSVELSRILTDRVVSRSRDTQWQLTELTVAPGTPDSNVPGWGGGNSAALPCGTYYRNASATCRTVASGTRIFNPGTTNLPTQNVPVNDLEVGTRLCYGLSVQPRAHNSSQWRHSSVQCAIVGKKPKFQVHGGDVSVGGLINTSTTNKNMGGNPYFW